MTTPRRPIVHTIEWSIEAACPPRAKFGCVAQLGADCRSWCVEESCRDEEFCSSPPGPNHDPADGPPHRWADTGRCYVIEYLTNSGTADELYAGVEETPLRSGWIETSWEGDGYEWEYADPPVDRRDLRADMERSARATGLVSGAADAERLVEVLLPLVDAYAWRLP